MEIKLEHWPPAKFKPYRRNPRVNDHAVTRMVEAIKRFGFTVPVLAQADGTVIDGHLRLKAAKVLKLGKLPVVRVDHLSPPEVKALRLLTNRSVAWADWDRDLLLAELDDLKLDDIDMALTGFDDDFLQSLDAQVGDDDTAPARTPAQEPGNPAGALEPDPGPGHPSPVLGHPSGLDDDYGFGPLQDIGEDPSPRLTGGPVPLAVNLDQADYARWVEYKDHIGVRRDTPAFLRLFEAATAPQVG